MRWLEIGVERRRREGVTSFKSRFEYYSMLVYDLSKK